MKSPFFHFKHFSVRHQMSAMKIGVDSVLLGGWADLDGVTTILDVGSGCGILALMAVQRSSQLTATGIEIEPDAAAEATENFRQSPWSDRLRLLKEDFSLFCSDPRNTASFDMLISNPPYFSSGISEIDDPRKLARHQGTLSPFSIISDGYSLLKEKGRISMVLPAVFKDSIISEAYKTGYRLLRLTKVRGHISAPIKRILIEFEKNSLSPVYQPSCSDSPLIEDELILESSPGVPTQRHRQMLHEFYLKF